MPAKAGIPFFDFRKSWDDKMDPVRNSPSLWLSRFPFPKREGHKYDRGHALIYGGAVMTGAARLAARAAQRIGAGLVTLAAPGEAVPIYAVAMESVIVRVVDDVAAWEDLLQEPKRNVMLIGPGLGAGALQRELVLAALATRKPCVLDADALNNFADKPDDLFAVLHEQCVLTPHEGEFARLFGARIDAGLPKAERAHKAAALA
jgi:NAD(P)H-hydrate epimerase